MTDTRETAERLVKLHGMNLLLAGSSAKRTSESGLMREAIVAMTDAIAAALRTARAEALERAAEEVELIREAAIAAVPANSDFGDVTKRVFAAALDTAATALRALASKDEQP